MLPYYIPRTSLISYPSQLYESEMRCAVIEAETREEVMREMEERMLNMERVFAKRLKSEVSKYDCLAVRVFMYNALGQAK